MKHAKPNVLAKQLYFVAALILVCIALIVICIVVSFRLYNLQHKYEEVSTKVITKVETVVVEKEKEVIVKVEKEPNYTNDELYCMAVAIYNEAGSNKCTDEQRELVGYVVLNRVNSSKYPNTIREVLEQPGQYEGLSCGVQFAQRSSNNIESKALERAWSIAKKVLENRDNIPIPKNVVFQAEFPQGESVYKHIDNTYFCY